MWSVSLNAPGNSTGAEIFLAGGVVYVAGPYAGDLSLGELVAPELDAGDVFVAAVDASAGNPLWLERGGGDGSDGDPLNMGLAVSPDATLLAVSGSIDRAATFEKSPSEETV